jgi:hypothetical protein
MRGTDCHVPEKGEQESRRPDRENTGEIRRNSRRGQEGPGLPRRYPASRAMVQQEEELDRGTTHTRVKCLIEPFLISALELSPLLMRDQDLFK